MPEYKGKKYPYTAKGMKAFIKARKKKKKGEVDYPHDVSAGGGPPSGGGGAG